MLVAPHRVEVAGVPTFTQYHKVIFLYECYLTLVVKCFRLSNGHNAFGELISTLEGTEYTNGRLDCAMGWCPPLLDEVKVVLM